MENLALRETTTRLASKNAESFESVEAGVVDGGTVAPPPGRRLRKWKNCNGGSDLFIGRSVWR